MTESRSATAESDYDEYVAAERQAEHQEFLTELRKAVAEELREDMGS